MIVYDLHCEKGHRFEGWFGSSSDFENQQMRRLVQCPHCGSEGVTKAPMAPAVSANVRGDPQSATDGPQLSNLPMSPAVEKALKQLVKAQAEALKQSTYVGDRFADEARSQHYGEKEEAPIYGNATRKEAADLAAEGIAVAPLLFAVADPDKVN